MKRPKVLDGILEGIDRKTGMGFSSVFGSPARYLVPYEVLERLASGKEQALVFEKGPQSIPLRTIEFVAMKDGKSYGMVVAPKSVTGFSESELNPGAFDREAPSAARQGGIDDIALRAGFENGRDFYQKYYTDRGNTVVPIRPMRVSNFDIERGLTRSYDAIQTPDGEVIPLNLPGEASFDVYTFKTMSKIHEIVNDDSPGSKSRTGAVR